MSGFQSLWLTLHEVLFQQYKIHTSCFKCKYNLVSRAETTIYTYMITPNWITVLKAFTSRESQTESKTEDSAFNFDFLCFTDELLFFLNMHAKVHPSFQGDCKCINVNVARQLLGCQNNNIFVYKLNLKYLSKSILFLNVMIKDAYNKFSQADVSHCRRTDEWL